MKTILSPRSTRETIVAEITTWQVIDTPYSVSSVTNLYGLDHLWYASIRLPCGNEAIIGRHRNQAAALRSVRRHERQIRQEAKLRKRAARVSRGRLAETSIRRGK